MFSICCSVKAFTRKAEFESCEFLGLKVFINIQQISSIFFVLLLQIENREQKCLLEHIKQTYFLSTNSQGSFLSTACKLICFLISKLWKLYTNVHNVNITLRRSFRFMNIPRFVLGIHVFNISERMKRKSEENEEKRFRSHR